MGVHDHWVTPVGDSGWYLLTSDGDDDSSEEESEQGCESGTIRPTMILIWVLMKKLFHQRWR